MDYATREGSATAEADYRPATGTLDIPPGSDGETIWVTIVDDRLHENPETLELVLADPQFAVPGDLVATGTIKDDDAEPALRIADVSASERAGGMVFVATMEAVAGRTLTWDFQTRDGSAVAGEDYERRTGTLMFEAGETRKTIPVTIVDDTMDEVEEDFRVILRNPRDSGLPVPEPTGLILDDDDNAVVADAWASRFGRTVATQVVNAVAGRFAGDGWSGFPLPVRVGPVLDIRARGSAGEPPVGEPMEGDIHRRVGKRPPGAGPGADPLRDVVRVPDCRGRAFRWRFRWALDRVGPRLLPAVRRTGPGGGGER